MKTANLRALAADRPRAAVVIAAFRPHLALVTAAIMVSGALAVAEPTIRVSPTRYQGDLLIVALASEESIVRPFAVKIPAGTAAAKERSAKPSLPGATSATPSRSADPSPVAMPGGSPDPGQMYAARSRFPSYSGYLLRHPLQGAAPGSTSEAIFLIPLALDEAPAFTLVVSCASGGQYWLQRIDVEVKNAAFRKETIPLDEANTAIRTSDDPRKPREADALERILGTVNPDATWLDGPFSPPLAEKRRSAFFGDARIYEYFAKKTAKASSKKGTKKAPAKAAKTVKVRTEKSVHAGIDMVAPAGSPVTAPARGRVVLASARMVTGNSVVVEHGPGLYSLYFHLESVAVTEGETVERGELLGCLGSSGFSTGPHLHWELRLLGQAVNPESLFQDRWPGASLATDQNMKS